MWQGARARRGNLAIIVGLVAPRTADHDDDDHDNGNEDEGQCDEQSNKPAWQTAFWCAEDV
ncbi:hypothetical protein CEP80_13295 [Jonesia denitrificans]|nr:hypothetical protein CEP80_13295 [Jonesia denitrificans]